MPRIPRRRFLTSSLAALGAGAAPAFARPGPDPSGRLRLGLIGCGGRGRRLARIFAGLDGVEVARVSDVNRPRMERAAAELREAGVPAPERHADHRRIVERSDVDAVVIATCEHWHGIPFIQACAAGKDIYVEKPLSHTVREGRRMVEAARETGVIALMGTQQRAGKHFREATRKVRDGILGQVVHVECWNYHRIDRGGRPADRPPPEGLDWDRWLGPAPEVPFNPLRLPYSWWFDYGGGMVTNWAVHHIDTILEALGDPAPLSVQCMGGLLATDTLSDAPDTVETAWTFPGRVVRYLYRGFSNWHVVQNRRSHHGILFVGTDASLLLDRHGWELWEDGSADRPVETAPRSAQDGPWQRHFVDCVREREAPAVGLEESHRATVCCHLANVAYHTGRTVRWDAEREAVPDDEEAARYLDRPRRPGYELPEVG